MAVDLLETTNQREADTASTSPAGPSIGSSPIEADAFDSEHPVETSVVGVKTEDQDRQSPTEVSRHLISMRLEEIRARRQELVLKRSAAKFLLGVYKLKTKKPKLDQLPRLCLYRSTNIRSRLTSLACRSDVFPNDSR